MLAERVRYSILFILCTIVFGYLFFVLFTLQVSGGEKYFETRKKQNEFVNKEGKRGEIFATLKNGEVTPVVDNEILYKLVLSPKDIPHDYEDRLFILLNKITAINQDAFFNKLKNRKDSNESFPNALRLEPLESQDANKQQQHQLLCHESRR
jgi:cell division protein FtsI/penicillin-binding protein 2